jgi:hypothetical protein
MSTTETVSDIVANTKTAGERPLQRSMSFGSTKVAATGARGSGLSGDPIT